MTIFILNVQSAAFLVVLVIIKGVSPVRAIDNYSTMNATVPIQVPLILKTQFTATVVSISY